MKNRKIYVQKRCIMLLNKTRYLVKILEEHQKAPKIEISKRHLGIILTLVGFLLYAFYGVLFEMEEDRSLAPISIGTIFVEFCIFYFFMFLAYVPFCFAKGFRFFKCQNPKLIILRAIFSIICIWFFSIARIWNTHADNSILYSTDAIWVVIILLIL
ncbi:MAG: hypothetical protein WC341_16380, partial [Bacteroidales bacterium]